MTKNKSVFITCIDHSVSGEKFDLLLDEQLEMLTTSPKPSLNNLSKYYESENYISHTDSKRSLFEKVYHKVKKITLNNKVKTINKVSNAKKNLLDIGAGTGDFLLLAKKKGWNVEGVEPNINARNLSQKKGVYLIDDVKKLQSKKYDVITMWHVLEHVYDLKDYIKKLKDLLNTDGVLLIAVPNYKSYDASYYKQFWAAYDVPRHLWHFSKKTIKKLFLSEDMSLVKILPMKFDSYYVSLLSEKYKTGKMNPFKAFIIGFKSNLKAKNKENYSSHIYILKKQK